MDISETYIKMCEKAKEIQKLRLSAGESEGKPFIYRRIDDVYYLVPPDSQVWLPRQDQLQEMVRRTGYSVYDLISAIETFLCDRYGNGYTLFEDERLSQEITSMEQLWLAFVMKEKFNNVWNGEEWISAVKL